MAIDKHTDGLIYCNIWYFINGPVVIDGLIDEFACFRRGGDAPIAESDEDKPGVILDYDTSGNLVSLEILDASRRIKTPGQIKYQVVPLEAK